MERTAVWICGALALLLPPAFTQGKNEGGRLQKVEKAESGLRPVRKADLRKAKRLVQALRSEDEETRERAEEGLEEMGTSVLPYLKGRLKREKSPEVRWRLKKVIRAIQGEGPRTITKVEPRAVTPGETEDFFEEMQKRLRNMMEEMEKEFSPFIGKSRTGIPRLRIPKIVPGGKGKVFSSNESVRIQVGPGGVQLEIRRKGPDGKEEVKRYKAKSVEEFKKLYPDIAKKYNIGGNGFSFRFGPPPTLDFSRRLREILKEFGLNPAPVTPGPGAIPPVPPAPPRWRWWGGPRPGLTPVTPLPQPAPSGEKLGVYVGPVPDPLAQYLGLPPGYGLLVQEVLPGSLAERAGIQPKDIILTVNGVRITGVEDVKNALSKVPAGGEVKVSVIRKGQKVDLSARKGGVKPLKKVKV